MSTIRDFVMNHPLFCHHDHHADYETFDAGRGDYSYASLLGYAAGDLVTAAGVEPPNTPTGAKEVARLWPKIRVTGYGHAVRLGCCELFGLEYKAENFPAITEALAASLQGKSASETIGTFSDSRTCITTIQLL